MKAVPIGVVIGLCVSGPLPRMAAALAQSAGPAANAPSAAPSAADVEHLIAQLGDPDPALREAATRRLRQLGKPAVEALRAAESDPSPEISMRAKALVRFIEQPPLPGPIPRLLGENRTRIQAVFGGAPLVTVTTGGREISIHETDGQIEMTVLGLRDGREVTETYRAADAGQLKADNPQAYALYERYRRGGVQDMVVFGGGAVQIGPMNALVVPPLEVLRRGLAQQMNQARIPARQQQDILQRLTRLQESRPAEAVPDEQQNDKRLEEYFRLSDDLRAKMAELKLPDPGDALPPPPAARLGVELLPGAVGLTIQRVAANSRGAGFGLKVGDIIQKAGRQDIRTVAELRQALVAAGPALVLQVVRDGKAMELTEKPAPATRPAP